MKARSGMNPGLCAVDVVGDVAQVSIFANVIAFKEEDQEGFEYDHYLVIVPNRPGLIEEVEANYTKWVEYGIQNQTQPKPETESEKVLRLEAEKTELEGVVEDLVQVLIDKGVVF